MTLSLRNTAPALRRHWPKSVSFAAAAAMLTLLGLKFLPPQYSSEAKLLVTVSGGDVAKAEHVLARETNQAAAELGSPAQFSQVVDIIGRQKLMPQLRSDDATAQYDAALQALRQHVTIAANQDSREIAISAGATHPDLARKIAATFVETYLQNRKRQLPAPVPPPVEPASEPVAEEQIALENAWNAASARLRELHELEGDLSLPSRRKLIEDQLAEVESQLRREQSKQQAEERRLATRLTPDHPQLLALREVIGDVSRQIQAAADASGEAGAPVEPSRNRFPGAIGLLCIRRQVLNRELAELIQREGRVSQAEREVELARLRLEAQAQQHPLAPVAPMPDQGRPIEITVAQSASPARHTAGVQPLWTIAWGAALGVFGGIGVALVCYHDNPLLKTCQDVQAQMELAVSGPIPTADAPLDVAA